MNEVASPTEVATAKESTEFDRLLLSLTGLPAQRKAIWNSLDHRKSHDVFFPGVKVSACDRILFVLNNRTMMAAVFNADEKKFYLRCYWLAFEYMPGYISHGLFYEEAAAVLAEFIDLPVVNFRNTKVAALAFRQIVGRCGDNLYCPNNVLHNKVMERIFKVGDFIEHIENIVCSK